MPRLTLDQIAAMARDHTITPEEKRAQRVSLITGVLAHNSTLTREKVASVLDQIEGHDGSTERQPSRQR